MADEIPTVAHAQILKAIRAGRTDVISLRKATKVQTDCTAFDLVERNLAECHAALSSERDQARVVTILNMEYRALALVGGGDVAPAVRRTRDALRTILQELEGRQPG